MVQHPPWSPHPSGSLLLVYYKPFLEEGGICFLLIPQVWVLSPSDRGPLGIAPVSPTY